MKGVGSQIGDNFLDTLRKLLGAGYLEPRQGRNKKGEYGAPQGGILSPILSNIVLHSFPLGGGKETLDEYIAKYTASFLPRGGKERKKTEMEPILQEFTC